MSHNNATISPGAVFPAGYRPWLKFHTMTIYDSASWTQDALLRWNNATMSFDIYKIDSASLMSSGVLCWNSGNSEFHVVPYGSFSPPLVPPLEDEVPEEEIVEPPKVVNKKVIFNNKKTANNNK